MTVLKKEKVFQKRWNIGLKVSSDQEKKIKMEAIRKGMGISEYIKQTLLDSLQPSGISNAEKKE